MAEDSIIGKLPEPKFLNEIESLLRIGRAKDAASRLRTLLDPLCGPGRPLSARFLTVGPRNVELAGWNELPKRITEYDRKGKNITAVGIDFSWPGHRHLKPDENGFLEPFIETSFYCDADEWPFSTSDRAALLKCYTKYGPKWQGGFEELDHTIAVKGIADLYGAVFLLAERRSVATDERQARVLGACYLAVLVHLVVRGFTPRRVLPRPMAVIVGSNEDYPLFSAPAFAAR